MNPDGGCINKEDIDVLLGLRERGDVGESAKLDKEGIRTRPGVRVPGVRVPGVRVPGVREPGVVKNGNDVPLTVALSDGVARADWGCDWVYIICGDINGVDPKFRFKNGR